MSSIFDVHEHALRTKKHQLTSYQEWLAAVQTDPEVPVEFVHELEKAVARVLADYLMLLTGETDGRRG